MNVFLHDPSWTKVHAATMLGTVGLIAIILQWIVLARAGKRNRYKLDAVLSEMHGPGEFEEVQDSRTAHNSLKRRTRRRPGQFAIPLRVLCMTAMAFFYLFALRGYIVLANWQDGLERVFVGDPVGAIICYKKALRVDPTLRRTHLLIGEALYGSGRVRAAIPELLVAANGEVTDPEAAATLGDAYQALKIPDKAVGAYRQAAAISPGIAEYYLVLGTCFEKLGRWTEAVDAYDQALRLAPSYTLAHIRLGLLLVNSGRREEGMAHCRKAVILAPQSVLAHNTLGTVYSRYGKYSNALDEYKIAVELNPRFLIGQANLGLVLEKMNESERALLQFRACLKLTAVDQEEKDIITSVKSEIVRLEERQKK